MGMLHEIFNAKLNLDWTLDKAETKRKIIENSIYGVDIEKGAVDIAMLRFWLSLVVDEEDPSPLPNLDYKIMVGNSLTGDNVDTCNMFHKHFLDEIQNLRHAFYKANETEEKKRLKKQIDDETKKLATSLNVNLDDGFNFKMEFSEVFDTKGGFDIVIGNPPYVNIYNIKDSQKLFFQKNFKSAIQKFDLYIIFMEKAISLLTEKGGSCLITSNKWLSQGYGKGIRDLYLGLDLQKILNFNFDIFSSATVDTNITFINKSNSKKETLISNILIDDYQKFGISNLFFNLKFNKFNHSLFYISDEKNFRLNLNNQKIAIIDKIRSKSVKLENICYIAYGLRGNSSKLGVGKEYFVKSKNENEKCVRYFEGKDIKKWTFNSDKFFEYQPDLHYNSMFRELFENKKLVSNEVIGRDKFRVSFDDELRYNNHTVINIVKYNIIKNVDYRPLKSIINKDKIELSNKIDYKFIIPQLNSSLVYWYFKELLAIDLHFYPNYVKSLPIFVSLQEEQKPFIEIVDKIIDGKKKGIDTTDLEKQIDQMVYKLYDLTEEEIMVIEGS